MRGAIIAVAVAVFLVCIAILFGRWYVGYRFEIGCTNYLKRAADAPNVVLALRSLDTATAYLDDHGIVTGNTGILFIKPSNDVGYWREQLAGARAALVAAESEKTSVAESNALIKLRETLQDQGSAGSYLTMPIRLSTYPNHIAWVFAVWFVGILACVAVFAFCVAVSE